MKSLIVFIKELPKPITYTSLLYFGALLLYNASGSYIDAKDCLKKYREHKLTEGRDQIRTEWEAVKYGASLHSGGRLWDSIIWPITLTNNIIPFLVLTQDSLFWK